MDSQRNNKTALFAPEPARDGRFSVKERWQDCENLKSDDPRNLLEFLHRQMNEEIDGMECAAQNLADFPDAPWELRMQIARQVSDESRHVEMFRKLFEERGGTIGEYSVLNFQFRIISVLKSLEGRLAVQNRMFETEGIDAIEPEIAAALEKGDTALAELFDAQLADEITHVRYANEYLRQVVRDSPRTVMSIGRDMNQASIAFLEVMGQESIDAVTYGVNEAGRLQAGFTPEEILQAIAGKKTVSDSK